MSTAALNDLGVAIQSVVYYVAACSTIRKCVYRRKRQKEAARARDEKAKLETEQPGLYNHPLPFATNSHWQEEIRLGPGPPKRDRRKAEKPESKWAMMGMGSESMIGSSPSDQTRAELVVVDTQPTIEESEDVEGWNRSRYQREDEELWGHDVNKPARNENTVGRPRTVGRGSTVGLVGVSRAVTDYTEKYHYTVRCPPVNELHPPVVSSPPTNGGQMRWMLQPPPTARIMEGKERANRGRAGTSGSSQKSSTMSKQNAQGTVSGADQSSSKRSRRSRATRRDSDAQEFDYQQIDGSPRFLQKKQRPAPIAISEDRRSSSTPPRNLHSSPRPPLKTLASSPIIANGPRSSAMYTTNLQSSPLKDLFPPSNILNSKPAIGDRRQPSYDRESSTVVKDETRVPVLESLFPYTFRFPDPATDRSDVMRQRWSMDI